MENENKKKIVYGLIGLLLVGLVFAGYVVSSASVNVSVKEAFTNEYAVSPDNNVFDCSTAVYSPLEDEIDLGELYPLDTRTICIKVSNEATNDLDYETTEGGELSAVATTTITPESTEVLAGGSVTDEIAITMNANAPVGDYTLSVGVTRG
jgi:hypothetical protein